MKKGIKLLELCLQLFVIFVFVFPFLWMLTTAFKTLPETTVFPPKLLPEKFIWSNFAHAWKSAPFALYMKNSIIVTFSIIVMQFLIMVPAAYGFAKYKFKGKGIMFSIVLLAFMIPGQITFVPLYLILSKWGIMNSLLPQIIPFAANAFGIFLLRQYFMQVPEEIIEAAKLDNASNLKIMYKIMVPMAKPAMATIALFSFIGHWNAYFWPLVMTNNAKLRPLTIGVAMLRSTEGGMNWHYIMAGNMILVLPILVMYLIASKQIVKAFVYTGIK